MANSDERSQIVKIASSNRTVVRKNVYVEPANWLLVVNEAMSGLVGGHCRDTTLNSPEIRNAHFDNLFRCVKSHEAQEIA